MDRATNFPQTQLLKGKLLFITLKGGGSGKAPTMLAGDPNASFFTAPKFVSTGIWTMTSQDPWPTNVGVFPSIMQATGAGTTTIQLSPAPVQNTSAVVVGTVTCPANSWTFTFNTFTSSSAADLLTGDQASLLFAINNSSLAT